MKTSIADIWYCSFFRHLVESMTRYLHGDDTILTELDIDLTMDEYLQMQKEWVQGFGTVRTTSRQKHGPCSNFSGV